MTIEGEKVPRPFGPTFFGTAPSDRLQFDYFKIASSSTSAEHVLMLRYDHPDYKRFFACHNLTGETASKAVIGWCTSFGVPKSLMGDGPTHFKIEMIRLICKGLKVPHHFVLLYFPWLMVLLNAQEKSIFVYFDPSR